MSISPSVRVHRFAPALCSAVTLAAAILLGAGLPTPAGAVEACPNEAYRTGLSASLPDCRAYELVTPPHKNANYPKEIKLSGGQSLIAAASSSWSTSDVGTGGLYSGSTYYFGRSAAGWFNTSLNPPLAEYVETNAAPGDLLGVGSGGSETLLMLHGRSLPEAEADIYLEPSPGAPLADIGPLDPPDAPSSGGGAGPAVFESGSRVVGYSGDLTHVLFETNYDNGSPYYWPSDEPMMEGPALYEYVGAAGAGTTRVPTLVGVSDGHTIVAGENGGEPLEAGELISECGTVLGGVASTRSGERGIAGHNSVSSDGGTVFFTARRKGLETHGGTCVDRGPEVSELYARVEGSTGEFETVAISEPAVSTCALCDEPETVALGRGGGHFVAASADGSKVFFETEQPLLGGDATNNIYEYDFNGPSGDRVTRVSGGDATVSDPVAEVQGVVQVSEDGSHVYFVAKGELTKTPNEFGQVAQAGADNLYLYDTQTGRTAFIGALSESDSGLWFNPHLEVASPQTIADASPDGRFLVFTSTADLTPGDTSTGAQVFEYDALTGELVRASKGEDGYNDDGNTSISAEIVGIGISGNTSGVPGAESRRTSSSTEYWSHLTMSEDGAYVFFTSADALTPQAPAGSSNIYEYHSVGSIGNGSVSLIADGALLGTDASGADVFFTTTESLVAQDTDTQNDIYDARIDGGFPPPAVFDECAGEECQGELSPAPVLLAPGSESQAGSAPPLAAPAITPKPKAKPKACKKGFVKNKKNKCVRKPKKKAKRVSANRGTK